MPTTQQLEDIADLSETFKYAVQNLIGRGKQMSKEAKSTLKPGEFDELASMSSEFVKTGMAHVSAGECSDDLLRQSLALSEKVTDIAARFVPVKELFALLPDSLKNKTSADFLRSENAPALAKLCEYKPA